MLLTRPLAEILLLLPALLFSLIIHEYAHARTALSFGDPTAKHMGRLTLNPMAHLDPIGTLAMLFIGFGWAKPVPVNPFNLHPRRLGDIAVSLAGPMSNLLLAVVSFLLLRVWFAYALQHVDLSVYRPVAESLIVLGSINIVLCTFNLIPLFPLDGHHILREILPDRLQEGFMRWQLHFGRVLLMAILFGPRLISAVTNNPNVPDPLHWVIRHAGQVVLTAMGMG